mmetsp:Transcript_32625/g.84255  ORF Transcript_32625/g.84255 Transcript_32625/m.84255 type:complete len:98 (+) Transcript_32625:1193-1486(+)
MSIALRKELIGTTLLDIEDGRGWFDDWVDKAKAIRRAKLAADQRELVTAGTDFVVPDEGEDKKESGSEKGSERGGDMDRLHEAGEESSSSRRSMSPA